MSNQTKNVIKVDAVVIDELLQYLYTQELYGENVLPERFITPLRLAMQKMLLQKNPSCINQPTVAITKGMRIDIQEPKHDYKLCSGVIKHDCNDILEELCRFPPARTLSPLLEPK